MDIYSGGFKKVPLGNKTDYTLTFHCREERIFLIFTPHTQALES